MEGPDDPGELALMVGNAGSTHKTAGFFWYNFLYRAHKVLLLGEEIEDYPSGAYYLVEGVSFHVQIKSCRRASARGDFIKTLTSQKGRSAGLSSPIRSKEQDSWGHVGLLRELMDNFGTTCEPHRHEMSIGSRSLECSKRLLVQPI